MVLTNTAKQLVKSTWTEEDPVSNNHLFIHPVDLVVPWQKSSSENITRLYVEAGAFFNFAYIRLLLGMLTYANSKLDFYILNPNKISSTGTISSDAAGPKLMFGSGSTPATENDVYLESPINVSVSTSNTKYVSIENGKRIDVTKIVVTNTDSSNLVFQEVGGVVVFQARAGSTEYNGSASIAQSTVLVPTMLWRHVFDEPITIPPTESKTLVLRREQVLGTSTEYPNVSQHVFG